MDSLRACARAVVFETGLPEFPYSTVGSGFTLGYRGRLFVCVARHVIRGAALQRIHVFPTDAAADSFDLTHAYFPKLGHQGEDVEDFAVLAVSLQTMGARDRANGRLIHLTEGADAWEETKHTARFFAIGFPGDTTFVDYANSEIHTGQVVLEGQYVGYSAPYCHTLRVNNPLGLSTFSGMSGGPVFSLTARLALPSNLTFCGMALRGTPQSGLIHFLQAAVIRNTLDALISAPAEQLVGLRPTPLEPQQTRGA